MGRLRPRPRSGVVRRLPVGLLSVQILIPRLLKLRIGALRYLLNPQIVRRQQLFQLRRPHRVLALGFERVSEARPLELVRLHAIVFEHAQDGVCLHRTFYFLVNEPVAFEVPDRRMLFVLLLLPFEQPALEGRLPASPKQFALGTAFGAAEQRAQPLHLPGRAAYVALWFEHPGRKLPALLLGCGLVLFLDRAFHSRQRHLSRQPAMRERRRRPASKQTALARALKIPPRWP